MNTNAIQIKKKKQNKNKREGWKNIKLLSSTIFLFFLFMKKNDKRRLLVPKLLGSMYAYGVFKDSRNWALNTTATATLILRKKKVTTFWKKETFFFWGERFQGNTLLLKTFILFFENFLFSVAKTFPFLKTWFLEKKEMDPTW